MLCTHALERKLVHFPSGPSGYYRDGDFMIFACPHGCEDVVVKIVPNKEESDD